MSQSGKFVYVVLQYGKYNLTIDCLHSIERVSNGRSAVLVVDNNSPDNSAKMLSSFLSERFPFAKLLILEENKGFSAGNNIGCKYALETMGAEYLVVLNNDIVIEQEDFDTRVEADYAQTQFAVLGPDIFIPSIGAHRNPFSVTGDRMQPDNPSSQELEAICREMHTEYCRLSNPSVHTKLMYSGFAAPLRMGKRHLKSMQCARMEREITRVWNEKWSSGLYSDVPLQGAFLVFSPDYFHKMPAPFVPQTFLFAEEILMQMNCNALGLKQVYDSRIKVTHYEGSTRNAADRGDVLKSKVFQAGVLRDSFSIAAKHKKQLEQADGIEEMRLIIEAACPVL